MGNYFNTGQFVFKFLLSAGERSLNGTVAGTDVILDGTGPPINTPVSYATIYEMGRERDVVLPVTKCSTMLSEKGNAFL